MNRVGDWMQTYTGRAFWPLDPRPEEVFLIDVAHSLSMQCRFAGHCLRFYSVAEHSVLMTRKVIENTTGMLLAETIRQAAQTFLLHDGPEAYLIDLPRPVKRFIPDYKVAEDRVWQAVRTRFGLALDLPVSLKSYDNSILIDEMQQNMAPPPMDWDLSGEPLGVTLQFWTPEQAMAEFLALAKEIDLRERFDG